MNGYPGGEDDPNNDDNQNDQTASHEQADHLFRRLCAYGGLALAGAIDLDAIVHIFIDLSSASLLNNVLAMCISTAGFPALGAIAGNRIDRLIDSYDE